MTFFQHSRLQYQKIEIDRLAVSSESPQVQQRMSRIAENFQRLELMLSEVESTIQNDERLSAINDSIQEIEIEVNGRKKKWRPRPKSRKKSTVPKKPR